MKYHVLDKNQYSINVVFHFPVPDGNNDVGISWRNVVIMKQGGAENIKSILP